MTGLVSGRRLAAGDALRPIIRGKAVKEGTDEAWLSELITLQLQLAVGRRTSGDQSIEQPFFTQP